MACIRRYKYNRLTGALSASIEQLLGAGADGEWTGAPIDVSINAHREMPAVFTAEQDGRMTGMLYLFAPTQAEIEVSAFVHPAFRRRGIFRALLKDALHAASQYGFDKGLFVCGSGDVVKIMERWGCPPHHTELMMRYSFEGAPAKSGIDIRDAAAGELKELAALAALIFETDEADELKLLERSFKDESRTIWALRKDGEYIGMCGVSAPEDGLMIYGFGVRPDARRMGYGRAMLGFLQGEAAARGLNRLYLEVDEENSAAKALYESFGFSVTKTIRYYEFGFGRLMDRLG